MPRLRPVAALAAALSLLAGALLFAPIGSSQSGPGKLSPTPPVTLAPARTTPAPTPSPTPRAQPARPALPKTGLDAWLVALVGVALMALGTALRRRYPVAASPRRR